MTSWQILPDPITPDLLGPPLRAATGRALTPSFAGRGVLLPFRRDGKSDFASGAGPELTRAAVALVLGTECGSDTTHGELPWRTEFGTLLQSLRLRQNSPALAALAKSRIGDALARWVPSVRLRRIEVRTRGVECRIAIQYDVLDVAGQRVIAPGLETIVPVG